MENKVKVSVIIPVYNVEDYLAECLDSVVHQTLKEIEIILVDDGSTDNSLKIMQEYKEKYSNIVVFSHENHGSGFTRNVGLQKVRGEYIQFVDSDDVLELTMLEEVYQEAVSRDADMVLFDADVICEAGQEEIAKNYNYKKSGIYPDAYSGKEMTNRLLDNGDYRSTVYMRFVKTQVIREYQITFPEGAIHEDEWFSLKSMFCCQRVVNISKQFYHRRFRENSVMTSANYAKSCVGYMKTLNYMIEEYKVNGEMRGILCRYGNMIMNCMMRNYVCTAKSFQQENRKEVAMLKKQLRSVNYFGNSKYKIKYTFLPIYTAIYKYQHRNCM